jgi:hypothetical protein
MVQPPRGLQHNYAHAHVLPTACHSRGSAAVKFARGGTMEGARTCVCVCVRRRACGCVCPPNSWLCSCAARGVHCPLCAELGARDGAASGSVSVRGPDRDGCVCGCHRYCGDSVQPESVTLVSCQHGGRGTGSGGRRREEGRTQQHLCAECNPEPTGLRAPPLSVRAQVERTSSIVIFPRR